MIHHSSWSTDHYGDMTIISLARYAADVRHLCSGAAGSVPVDVLIEGPGASKLARYTLARLAHALPPMLVLHDDALLTAGRVLDDLLPGVASDEIPFLVVSIGRRIDPVSSDAGGIVLADPQDSCAVLPSVMVVARGAHIVGMATAIAAPKCPDSLIAATVSCGRAAMSTVLARHILTLGPTSAEPLLRMSDASGLAICADGSLIPC